MVNRHRGVFRGQGLSVDEEIVVERITIVPAVCGGRPCIRCDLLAAGQSEDEILADYPDLEREDIRAALQYHG